MPLPIRWVARFAFSSLAVAALSSVAGAQITVYNNNEAAFLTALGGTPTVEDFTNTSHLFQGSTLNSSSSYPGLVSPGDIQPGVTYSVGSGSLTIDGGGGFSGGFLDGPNFSPYSAVGPLTATFDSPVQGFGFLTNAAIGGSTQLIQVFQGALETDYTETVSAGNEFFGFVSTNTDITSVMIGGDASQFTFAVDDFTFGPVSPTTSTPEPATLGLLAMGLVCVGGVARRRKSRTLARD
jgi:hypothetical protein